MNIDNFCYNRYIILYIIYTKIDTIIDFNVMIVRTILYNHNDKRRASQVKYAVRIGPH